MTNAQWVGCMSCIQVSSLWKFYHHMVNIQKLEEKAYIWPIVGAQQMVFFIIMIILSYHIYNYYQRSPTTINKHQLSFMLQNQMLLK